MTCSPSGPGRAWVRFQSVVPAGDLVREIMVEADAALRRSRS